jgi:hypothetical protein
MADLIGKYADLKFTKQQIFLSDDEVRLIAADFWSTCAAILTDKDRGFVQGCLLIAVDQSQTAATLFDLFSAVVGAAPSRSVAKLVRDLAKRTAMRWFESYLHGDPRISAVGRSGVLYSALTAEWKTRIAADDTDYLTNFLLD